MREQAVDPLPDAAQLSDAALRAERDMLAYARDCLEAMRKRTASLKVGAGDDWSEEALAWHLRQRLAELDDDGATALFFGRLDLDAPVEGLDTDRLYVGRRHIRNPEGSPVVIDWRARIARPFYRATPTSRQGVRLRRRFGFQRGALTSIQDEPLDLLDEAASRAEAERALRAEIERPRIGPMRDIVVTIQPEQDDLIRAPVGQTICIQGGPGTGKTAVGLHRAAFLLYEHAARLRRSGVLIIGPSTAYLAFIREVLPGLGETRVTQQTLAQLLPVEVRGQDPPEAAAVKGDARMAEVVRRAAFGHVRAPVEPLALRYGHRRLRVGPQRLTAWIEQLRADGGRYDTARSHLREWVVGHCLRALEHTDGLTEFDSPRQVERKLGAAPELRDFLNQTWPKLDPARLVHKLLTQPQALAAAAGGLLTDAEQAQVRWPRKPRSLKAAPWSLADAALVDEAADVISGTSTYGHVIADEAQDLSPMQLRAVGRRCRFGSATLLGDLAQGTAPGSTPRWEDAMGHLGQPDAVVEHLPRAFRSPREILDFANRLLPEIAPAVRPAASVRSVPGALRLRQTTAATLPDAWVTAVRESLAEEGSVGLIVTDALLPAIRAELAHRGLGFREVDVFDTTERLSLVPASAAKGLEFDQVVMVEPADLAATGTPGLRQLYIALTRAVQRLHVIHSRPLPQPLAPDAA